MLTILHPQLITIVRELSIGLLPVSVGEKGSKLIIKTTKEMLLAAKVNRGFKIYVSPVTLASSNTVSLVSAFFDDADEPLVIFTPLFNDDPTTYLLLQALTCETLDIHFFDEHCRELLGYVSKVKCPLSAKDLLTSSSFCDYDLALAISAHDQMRSWFGHRSQDDDHAAIAIEFVESLIPDDLLILDAQPDNHLFQGSSHFSFSQLERDEPGTFQERDIANLLKNLFSANDIYMNPLRTTDREEIADILVITESEIIVVQAKDSPNIERVLKNAIDRKKSTAFKSLLKALSQTRGAIKYVRSMSPLKMIVAGENVELDIGGRNVRCLVVVKELFNNEYSLYSPPVLELSTETQVPCIALDYPELQGYMTGLSSKESFFAAFDKVFRHGVETGKFPRLRIWNEAVL